jgi:hypothetical protein
MVDFNVYWAKLGNPTRATCVVDGRPLRNERDRRTPPPSAPRRACCRGRRRPVRFWRRYSEGSGRALRENAQDMLGSLYNRKAGHFIENIAA